MDRRLAAIMAVDVVGYSRLMGADEAGTLARLKALRRELVQPRITEHKGRTVKLMGDGLLAEFPSVVEAVGCAAAIQDALTEREAGQSGEDRIQLRIGVNLGDIIAEGSDIYGDGVNVAARLESLAVPGGVCISGTAFDSIDGKLDLPFKDAGEHNLRNISKPVRVYRLSPLEPQDELSTPRSGSLPLPDKPSIAVLPFTNMNANPEQEYFSDGITEDIITELSRFSGLFVIARNSSFTYKGQAVDIRQVARELGVRYVLEGSVRRGGKRLRITAQLIDSSSGGHVWSEKYDRDLEDLFELQDEITRNVVGAIAPQIERAEIARVRSSQSGNVSAYDQALKGQALYYDAVRMGDQALFGQSLDTLALALEQDPRNINALWIRALALGAAYLYRWGDAPDEALNAAWVTVDRLIDTDPSDSRAYTARGFVQQFRGEFDAAVADYRYAFALNPNFAINIFLMAWCEALAGLTSEAKEHAELGLRLSPRDNEIWVGCAYLALAEASFAEGNYDETEKWAKLGVQLHPRAPIRRALVISCCVRKGDLKQAKEHLDFLNSFAPDFVPSILGGNLTLYKMPEHNALLIDGLRKAEEHNS